MAVTDSRQGVYVEDYGAVGDGSANDATAIQAALDTGLHVRLKTGKTYKVTTTLTMATNGQRFFCDYPGAAKLIAPGSAVNFGDGGGTNILIVRSQSSFPASGSWKLLTANARTGGNTVAVDDADDIASAGDYIALRSEKNLPSPNPASNNVGQFYRVLAKSSSSGTTTYVVQGQFAEDYDTADTAKVAKVTVVERVLIENIQFGDGTEANGGARAIQAQWTDGLSIQGCLFRTIGGGAVELKHNINWRVGAIDVDRLPAGSGTETAQGYGVVYSGMTRNGRIFQSTFTRCRHAETDVSSGEGYGAPIDVLVLGCNASNCSDAEFDTHEYVQNKRYIGCSAIGNFSSAAPNAGFQCRARLVQYDACYAGFNWSQGLEVNNASGRAIITNMVFEGNSLTGRGGPSNSTALSLIGEVHNSRFINNYNRAINVDGDCIISGCHFEGNNNGVMSGGNPTTGNVIHNNGTDLRVQIFGNKFVYDAFQFAAIRNPEASWLIENNDFSGWTAGNEIRTSDSTHKGYLHRGNRMSTSGVLATGTVSALLSCRVERTETSSPYVQRA